MAFRAAIMRSLGRIRAEDTQVRFLLGCLALIVAVVAARSLGTPERAAAQAHPQPNIIVIQADDQTLRQFTPDVMPETERLLTDQGTEFTNYVATTAQCCPSRASLLTGQYAHNHGVTSNTVGCRARATGPCTSARST